VLIKSATLQGGQVSRSGPDLSDPITFPIVSSAGRGMLVDADPKV